MKKFLLVLAALCIGRLINAQSNVFHLPVQIIDGTQGIGKVLTSDSSGLGSWQQPYNWLLNGNYLDTSYSIGSLNNYPVNIMADGVNKIIIWANDTMQFKGISMFDTLIVPIGYIYADSIRARIIHVGDSSLTIGSALPIIDLASPVDYISSNTNTIGLIGPMGVPGGLLDIGIGIGNEYPVSMLHIGDDIVNNGRPCTAPIHANEGWRDWMTFGTFYTENSDNMYVGMKDEGPDRKDAIIDWGDDATGNNCTNGGPDHLRFIFTEDCGNVEDFPAGENGLEVARVTPQGYWGIGTTYYNTSCGSVVDPTVRLEVVDGSATQLRLSNTIHSTTQAGVLTNFFTDPSGNLNIQPFS